MEKDYGSHYVTYTSERVDIIVPELIKVFSGSIRKSSKGFGIADGVFIPDSLLVGIDNHAFVSGKSFPSFDKKKGEWGWTAFQINC